MEWTLPILLLLMFQAGLFNATHVYFPYMSMGNLPYLQYRTNNVNVNNNVFNSKTLMNNMNSGFGVPLHNMAPLLQHTGPIYSIYPALSSSNPIYNANAGNMFPVIDSTLPNRHLNQEQQSEFFPVLTQEKQDSACEQDADNPNVAVQLFKKVYGQRQTLTNAVGYSANLAKELNIIGDEKFFISLIRQKLNKLVREERKRLAKTNQSTKEFPIDNNHNAFNLHIRANQEEPEEEFRYTTFSTFIGDFFCAWCKTSKGQSKRHCLRFCFQSMLEKYDNS